MKNQSIPADLATAIQARGGKVVRTDPEIGMVTVSGLSSAAIAALTARADVEGIDADVVTHWLPPGEQFSSQVRHGPGGSGAPIDQSGVFFFPFQWNMRVIKADSSWLRTREGNGSLVCILDTGVDPNQVELAGRIDLGKSTSFVTSEPFIEDLNAHGTFVSSIVTTNGVNLASVAPKARLCAVKVLGASGNGSFADLISGLMYAARNHADVINMSLGAYFSKTQPGALELIHAVQRAVDFAASRGVLLVAAAGNNGINLDKDPRDSIAIPAQLHNVLSVGATAPFNQANFDNLASYTNFGVTGVDVMAPGGDLLTGGDLFDLVLGACSEFSPFGCGPADYLIGAGTSFAAPHASGTGAVAESEGHGNQNGFVLSLCLELGADDLGRRGIDPLYGFGRIDVLGAARKCGHGFIF
jgi:subtilisin family serine protease